MRAFLGGLGLALLAACTSPHADQIHAPLPVDGWLPESGGTTVAGALSAPAPPRPEAAPGTYPVDLSTVLRLAGGNALTVALARERAVASAADESIVLSRFFPTAGPRVAYRSADGIRQNTPGQFLRVDRQSLFLGGYARLELAPAETWYDALAARKQTEARVNEIMAAGHDALLAAARMYYDLIEAYARIGIAEQTLRYAQELLAFAQTRQDLGAGLPSDTLRARARVRQAEGQLARARGEAAVASARLAELLVLDAGTELVPGSGTASRISFVDVSTPLPVLVQRMLRARPDLRAARARLGAAEESAEGADKAWMFPRFRAEGELGAFGENFGRLSDTGNFFVGIEWELGAAIPARQERAQAQRRAAAIQVTRTERRAIAQIQTAVETIRAGEKQLVAAEQEAAAAREGRDIARAALDEGKGLLLELYDLQAAVVRAETSRARAILDLNRAQYELLHAVGGPVSP